MLSTTRNPREAGQVLVLFAGGAIALLIIAALAFDVGMMLLERRDQQNAADAAALAGARYVLESDDFAGSCAAVPAGNRAVEEACKLALTNGFSDADASENVFVYLPPQHGRYQFDGFIEVQIESNRASIFGGVVGRSVWPVGTFAVAGNQPNLALTFSMLSLAPDMCKAMQFAGGGTVIAYGNIHANSTGTDCGGDPVAFSRTGGATVEVRAEGGACQAVGDIQDPTDDLQCAKQSPSFVMPDPLQWLAEPPRPTVVAPDMDLVGEDPDTTDQPDRCPGADGGDAPRLNQTQPCDVGGNGAAYANKSWILYPGLYPAGLAVTNGATAYLMPGIYWLGGGGLNVKGGGAVISIATEADAALTPAAATFGGGVLLYNGEPGNEGPINMEGSAATMKLEPFDVADGDPLSVYNDIVIFQSRTVDDTITLNGSASITDINGIIYSPIGGVKLNGNGGTMEVDQIIAWNFDVEGTGSITVTRETGVDVEVSGAGLVD